MPHPSSSEAQRAAEGVILAGLVPEVGPLTPRSLALPGGARVDVDGVAPDESVLVEVFAHQGPMKGGQPKKVALDALKLITLGRDRPSARLIIAFGDEAAVQGLTGRGWLSEALRTWNIELRVVDLDAATRAGLLAAQLAQRMVNPTADRE